MRTDPLQHAFPHDFRAGLRIDEWDPSKWLLLFLHRFGLVWGLRRAREEDIDWAVRDMRRREEAKTKGLDPDEACAGSDTDDPDASHEWVNSPRVSSDSSDEETVWNLAKTLEYARTAGRCVLVVDGYVVDASKFMGDHVRLSHPAETRTCTYVSRSLEVPPSFVIMLFEGTTRASLRAKRRTPQLATGAKRLGHTTAASTTTRAPPQGGCASCAWPGSTTTDRSSEPCHPPSLLCSP